LRAFVAVFKGAGSRYTSAALPASLRSRPGRFTSPLLALAVVAGSLASLPSCDTTDSTAVDTFAVTSVALVPDEFLNSGIACVPGGMRTYVATLVDVTPSRNESDPRRGELALPSSAPTPCYAELRFERVVIGREYAADVQGYDREDIVPIGCYPDATPGCAGSPVMVDRATGVYVAPRWKTSCGRHRVRPAESATPPAPPAPIDGGAVLVDAAAESPPPAVVTEDAGSLYYYDCRGKVLVDGETPWLEGPVCVLDLVTSKLRGCDPLSPP
jgi:hypothetical protein